MKDPEQDELWALLGKAKRVEPSAFFKAKVLAAVRQVDARRRSFWRNWISFGLPGAAAGAMAVFLASARAANVTGQTINVDGGYVMR